MYSNNNRPVFLDLTRIRFPVTALASIGHRISGAMLFLSLPAVLYLFGLSLQSAADYARVTALLSSTPLKLLAILYSWSLAHHLLGGVRHLLVDMEIGVGKRPARLTAVLVLASGLLALSISAVAVW